MAATRVDCSGAKKKGREYSHCLSWNGRRAALDSPRMTARIVHRLGLFSDRDVLHAMAVAGAACVLSAGLVYVGYFVHVLRIARKAPCLPAWESSERGDCVLLFGKHAPQGRVDVDFAARIQRAAQLWRERPPRSMVLLGGGPAGQPTEAELARAQLIAHGVAADAPLLIEAESRDTLQNLRNARALLGAMADRGRVVLLSSRYHLARCALFARQLGVDAQLCAAEARFQPTPRNLWRLAGEAGYVCLTDIGTRWARLIGHRRMLARVT